MTTNPLDLGLLQMAIDLAKNEKLEIADREGKINLSAIKEIYKQLKEAVS